MPAFAWSDPAVVAAVVGAVAALITSIVATPLRYVIDKRALRHRLTTEYEYEQRKELRELIGRYHGRMLEAADSWSHRMTNLYKHESEGMLAVSGRYSEPDYYFRTTVYRFLGLFALVRQFEREARFIDARIAESTDLDFLKFAKAFRWTMTDLELVERLEYDAWKGSDHFFNDDLRSICDDFVTDGEPIALSEFESRLTADRAVILLPALRFFDGLCADEPRLRWDRLVALHLLVAGFLNVIGYDMQRSDDAEFGELAGRLRHREVGENLATAIPRLGLAGQPEAVRAVAAFLPAPARRSRPFRRTKELSGGESIPPAAPVR